MRIPWQVATTLALLALLIGGSLAAPSRPAAAQDERCFAETGFCVRGRFLDYWVGCHEHGLSSLAVFPWWHASLRALVRSQEWR